jgi:hypothetical protein
MNSPYGKVYSDAFRSQSVILRAHLAVSITSSVNTLIVVEYRSSIRHSPPLLSVTQQSPDMEAHKDERLLRGASYPADAAPPYPGFTEIDLQDLDNIDLGDLQSPRHFQEARQSPQGTGEQPAMPAQAARQSHMSPQ